MIIHQENYSIRQRKLNCHENFEIILQFAGTNLFFELSVKRKFRYKTLLLASKKDHQPWQLGKSRKTGKNPPRCVYPEWSLSHMSHEKKRPDTFH